MRLEYMMTRDVQEAKEKNLPVIIPIGTIEWHGPHCALGCDTFVCTGLADKIAEQKEVVVAPPVWYGVASYAVGGPENGTVHIDVDVYELCMDICHGAMNFYDSIEDKTLFQDDIIINVGKQNL